MIETPILKLKYKERERFLLGLTQHSTCKWKDSEASMWSHHMRVILIFKPCDYEFYINQITDTTLPNTLSSHGISCHSPTQSRAFLSFDHRNFYKNTEKGGGGDELILKASVKIWKL